MSSLVESGEIIERLGERILGRIPLEDVIDPFSEEVIVRANEMIDEEAVEKIENTAIEEVKVRSVMTCELKRGICQMCYGCNLATGKLADIGEAIGIIAAQSIGEPGTQLTMRTFHIGGTASRVVEQNTLESKRGGIAKYVNLKTVTTKNGDIVVMNRNGQFVVQDESGREKERYPIVYGARLKIKDGQVVSEGQKLIEWDPFTTSILTEAGGRSAFGDIVESITMKEEVDEVTGLSQKVILDHQDEKRQPRISIKDSQGRTIGRYPLPAGAHIAIAEGEIVSPGDVLAKIPRETTKTKDITGGLPRVAELFEARKPKEQAFVAEIDGVVTFGGFSRGMRRVVITNENGEEREYLIPRGKHISLLEGDRVKAGESLMEGAINPHDILDVLGEKELQRYLVNETLEVYRLQGVQINDKHVEVIVRQMLRKLVIEDAGDTDFLVGEQVEKELFKEKNEEVIAEGGSPAKGRSVLLGITKASLNTDSFISAASFQETTRVLTQAAVMDKVDQLKGLKENVIMGKLIPAGTGTRLYQNLSVTSEKEVAEAEEVQDEKETELFSATREQA